MSATVLVIDTATESVVTGVVAIDGPTSVTARAQRSVNDSRRHAEILTTLIHEVQVEAGIAGGDLDAVVVGIGPGPFTGLRVGMATAAAYGDALGVPVYGVCTLDALAYDAAQLVDAAGRDILVVTDARRREVYWARYAGGQRVDGPGVLAPADVDAADAVLVGPARFAEVIGGSGTAPITAPSASALAAVAAGDVLRRAPAVALEPLYLRRPDAVELKDQRRKSLLPVAGQ